jgi:hypothetical protein
MLQKIRQPDSLAGAVSAVCDVIGWARASDIIGKSESLVRQWGNPDINTQIDSIQHAIMLDAAYMQATKKPGPIAARMAEAARELAGVDLHSPKSLPERLIDLHSSVCALHMHVRDALEDDGKLDQRERKQILESCSEVKHGVSKLERDVKRVS